MKEKKKKKWHEQLSAHDSNVRHNIKMDKQTYRYPCTGAPPPSASPDRLWKAIVGSESKYQNDGPWLPVTFLIIMNYLENYLYTWTSVADIHESDSVRNIPGIIILWNY